jgi:hypothetical protein
LHFIKWPGALSSFDWSDRIQAIHEFRTSDNPNRHARVLAQHAHIDYRLHTIFNIPSFLYASRELPHDEHVHYWTPYLVVYPHSNINQMVTMTINGLSNQGGDAVNITLRDVYELLDILVKGELDAARELLSSDWNQRIQDSYTNLDRNKHHHTYDYLQYVQSDAVKAMQTQLHKESREIQKGSDILWEEKEMLWLISLGEHQKALLGLPSNIIEKLDIKSYWSSPHPVSGNLVQHEAYIPLSPDRPDSPGSDNIIPPIMDSPFPDVSTSPPEPSDRVTAILDNIIDNMDMVYGWASTSNS